MSLIECNKVMVQSTETKGLGAFASINIKKGDLVEKGVMKRIDLDGNDNPYLFTWSEDRTIWAYGSGCATFYNTSRDPNTKMIRNYNNDTFEIYANKDIQRGEELTHTYKSLEWRDAFEDLRKIKNL